MSKKPCSQPVVVPVAHVTFDPRVPEGLIVSVDIAQPDGTFFRQYKDVTLRAIPRPGACLIRCHNKPILFGGRVVYSF